MSELDVAIITQYKRDSEKELLYTYPETRQISPPR